MTPTDTQAWARSVRADLTDNVLPWWQREMFDAQGRLLGGRELDGRLLDAPRTAVLGTRVLWSFSNAARQLGQPRGQRVQQALRWVLQSLTDAEHGGLFWSVDAQGRPIADHKQTYAQAFGIYALASCPETEAQAAAWRLFELIDTRARDPELGGYYEGCTRDWQVLPGAKLSDAEPPAPKTTNTLLHVMEAFTELYRTRPEHRVRERLAELIDLFLDRLWRPQDRCFGQFFSRDWQNMTPLLSWGHDIESGWLLVRAAEVLGDAARLTRARSLAVTIADAVLATGMAPDGSMLGAGEFGGQPTDTRRHWWVQAEAMVGYWDAFEISGEARFAQAAQRSWHFISQHHVDRQHGDWIKMLDADLQPLPSTPKAGPWECPYHHVRAELEMLSRLARHAPTATAPADAPVA